MFLVMVTMGMWSPCGFMNAILSYVLKITMFAEGWMVYTTRPGVGVTKPISQNYQNTCYIYDITFIFDRCLHSRATETPGKYERDTRYLDYTFTKSNFPVTEKLTNGALVTPTPGIHHPALGKHHYLNQGAECRGKGPLYIHYSETCL